MSKNKANEVVFFQTSAMVGVQFMDRMKEYMELQDTPDFDVQQHLMNLYEDLSNLYNDNINE